MGARCVECHMPESLYMARDPRRDHSFNSPDPLLSVESVSYTHLDVYKRQLHGLGAVVAPAEGGGVGEQQDGHGDELRAETAKGRRERLRCV